LDRRDCKNTATQNPEGIQGLHIYIYDRPAYKITWVTFIERVINISWDFIAPAAFVFALPRYPLPSHNALHFNYHANNVLFIHGTDFVSFTFYF
jgi:hypothetical protein